MTKAESMAQAPLTLVLAEPRGFCAGVERAIEIVERALQLYGAPIYVRHEIVHNRWVVEDLKAKGVIFVRQLEEIPDGAITVFSAHGVSEKVENEARLRDLPLIDATCPLVTKVHYSAQRYEANKNLQVILIGHAGHPEVEGTLGRIKNGLLVSTVEDVEKLNVAHPDRLAFVTQTTLSVDETRDIITALRARFPNIEGPDLRDICYATQNRQNAIRELAEQVDLLLVVGSQKSSNSNRLRDLGEECGVPSHLIDDATGLNPEWLEGVNRVGLTAGASAPEHLVQGVIDALSTIRPITRAPFNGVQENTRFKLPREVTEKVY